MTVIRPNSVSGINSITAQANEIKIFKSDGTQGGLVIGGANLNATSGISTVAALTVTGNVSVGGTLTYQDVTNIDSVGIITARAGVHVTGGNVAVGHNNPSVNLHVKGSASNGQIYLGGTGAHSQIYADNDGVLILNADQGNSAANSYLGFNVDNTERLRIDSSGRMGIGENSPGSYSSGANNLVITAASGSNSGITLNSDSGGTDSGAIFFAHGSGANAVGRIRYYHSDDHMDFYTANAERLRITSAGRVGVNCTPLGQFQVKGATNANIALTAMSSEAAIEAFNDAGSANVPLRIRGTDIKFFSSSTERVRITSAGDVGINETSPQRPLHITGNDGSSGATSGNSDTTVVLDNAGTNGSMIEFLNANNGAGHLMFTDTDGPNRGRISYHHNGDYFRFDTNGSERVRITSAGFIGINVASPTNLLHVDGGTDQLKLSDGSGSFEFRAGNALMIKDNGTERMRIDSSGKVLINTTSPSLYNDRQLTVGDTSLSSSNIEIRSATNGWGGLVFSDSTASDVNSYRGSVEYSHGTNHMQFRTDAVERMRITSTGYTQMGGYLNETNNHRINGIGDTQGHVVLVVSGYQSSGGSSQDTAMFYAVNTGGSVSSSQAAIRVYRSTGTNRSINTAGTINTNGSDYAEYMTKAGDFTLAKGDICGINPEGKLTNVFADAVSFVVKSTDPSYVGGDKWHEVAGEQPGGYDDTRTEEEIAAAKVVYEEALETARQLVDRIAFSGQVPVNVTGATPGQHIIPTAASDGSIEGTAKAEADLTMAEYMSSVGKVIAIEDDGRARIIVKVA